MTLLCVLVKLNPCLGVDISIRFTHDELVAVRKLLTRLRWHRLVRVWKLITKRHWALRKGWHSSNDVPDLMWSIPILEGGPIRDCIWKRNS